MPLSILALLLIETGGGWRWEGEGGRGVSKWAASEWLRTVLTVQCSARKRADGGWGGGGDYLGASSGYCC